MPCFHGTALGTNGCGQLVNVSFWQPTKPLRINVAERIGKLYINGQRAAIVWID